MGEPTRRCYLGCEVKGAKRTIASFFPNFPIRIISHIFRFESLRIFRRHENNSRVVEGSQRLRDQGRKRKKQFLGLRDSLEWRVSLPRIPIISGYHPQGSYFYHYRDRGDDSPPSPRAISSFVLAFDL